ncbi:unnamed protein product, partial [marine sediment metagenome]
KDIELGDITVIDPVVWTSGGQISYSKLKVARNYEVPKENKQIARGNEVNPYYIASETFDLNKNVERLRNGLNELNNL